MAFYFLGNHVQYSAITWGEGVNREKVKKKDLREKMSTSYKEEIAQEKGRERFQMTHGITAASLGNAAFKKDCNLKYAYVTGAMYRGIASKEMVAKIAKAGMLGFFGTGGLEFEQIEKTIQDIRKELPNGQAFGMNLLHSPGDPKKEEDAVKLFLDNGVGIIEASAFMSITPPLVRTISAWKRIPAGIPTAAWPMQ